MTEQLPELYVGTGSYFYGGDRSSSGAEHAMMSGVAVSGYFLYFETDIMNILQNILTYSYIVRRIQSNP